MTQPLAMQVLLVSFVLSLGASAGRYFQAENFHAFERARAWKLKPR